MTRQEILDAIPHRDPFLLVDEVLERSETRIVASKTEEIIPDMPAYGTALPLRSHILIEQRCLDAMGRPSWQKASPDKHLLTLYAVTESAFDWEGWHFADGAA